ncbi:hypothetical protein C9I43_00430 (plasmid) [Shewanella morhuae]|uniref:Uncharacterized protein n=1 Tax=Shewanella morhuae TaxID=365591 RepID=A0ABX5HY70_9GAMM|nr:hypothetical protein C9I43_00430 [Shewanella morhuae]
MASRNVEPRQACLPSVDHVIAGSEAKSPTEGNAQFKTNLR